MVKLKKIQYSKKMSVKFFFYPQDGPHVRPGQLNEEDSHSLLDRYAEWGGNFIDTADVYADGLSEKIVGSWLKK